ncbi:MAG TPA: 50S ribosomal protein L6 [Gammaproteobacteria bacterium]|nr:50S ribosomal protein L6 [Gammaproteobacteria bacterium]
MSRVARRPVELPKGVEFRLEGRDAIIKGAKGSLSLNLHPELTVVQEDGGLLVRASRTGRTTPGAIGGTTRALLANMVEGVTNGFERRLELVGVGYRAQAQGRKLNLTLGFSHPISYQVPEDISVETPTQNEVIVRGADKQKVGQVAAEIRNFRPPEPYKGKGVRYANERIAMKEAKKK